MLEASAYHKIYEGLLPQLKQCPITSKAPSLGLTVEGAGALAHFLRCDFLITPDGILQLSGSACDINSKNVLIYYILSNGTGELSGKFLPLSSLTGIPRQSGTGELFNKPLLNKFAKSYALFSKAAEHLNCSYLGLSSVGAHLWFLAVLPKIHLQILYFEADEEFPCDIQFLFDTHCLNFLDFECLAFLNGLVCNALLQDNDTT